MSHRRLSLFALCAVGAALALAPFAFAGIRVPPGSANPHVKFVDCPVNGSGAQTITVPGEYMLNVSGDEAVRLCFDVACDGGNGTAVAPNSQINWTFKLNADAGAGVDCRSDGGTGDVDFTYVTTH